MNKCFSYQRFSTKKQEGGDSIERQTASAKAYAQRESLEYQDKAFSDLGVSGFSQKIRSGLEAMLEAVETGAIPHGSTVVIDGFDRLSRQSFEHTYDLIRQIVNAGVSLHIVQDNLTLDKSSLNDLVSVIRVALQSDLAHKESQKKSYLIRSQRTRARENRQVTGKLPMWIKRAENTLGFEFNDLIDTTKELIRLRAEGKSLQSVSKKLNEQNRVTSTGAKWSASGVRSIIKNKALYGAKEYFDSDPVTGRMNKTSIDLALDIFPAVITFDEWQNIQQKSKTGKGGRISRVGAYSYLLRCGYCGSSLTHRNTRYKDRIMNYRMCIGATEGRCDCNLRIREPEIYIDSVLKNLQYTVIEMNYNTRTPELQNQIKTLTETADILLQSANPQRLAALYQKLSQVEDELQKSIEMDVKQGDPITRKFANVLDIKDITLRNLELRKLLKCICFYNISKEKTTSVWRVEIEQINGFKITFVLTQRFGFGNSFVSQIADGQKLINSDVGSEFEPWEVEN